MAALAAALYLGVGAFLSALFSCVGLMMMAVAFFWLMNMASSYSDRMARRK